MKILLVDFNPFTGAVTPISLGNLAAVLTAAGHEVDIWSLGSTSRFSVADLRSAVRQSAPSLVGFATYQRNIVSVRALARLVKAELPAARVVLGGPQAMFMPDVAMADMPEVDYLSRGEGEQTILAIVEAVVCGDRDTPVPGVTSRTADGGWVAGPAVEPAADLDRYPSPWLTGLLDPATMDESILLTSRGCPHRCVFCITPAAFGPRIRSHSVERVLEDLRYVVSRGSGRLWFADPNFSFSRDRVVEILEGILRLGLQTEMWLETRSDHITPELVALMKRSGVTTVAMGLESASQAVHEHLNKHLDLDGVKWAARTLIEAGLDVELFSMFALPGETFDDALSTLRFVKECGVKIRGNSNAQQMHLYFGAQTTACPAEFGVQPLRDDVPPYLSLDTRFETECMSRREIARMTAVWRRASLDSGRRVVS